MKSLTIKMQLWHNFQYQCSLHIKGDFRLSMFFLLFVFSVKTLKILF